MGQPKSHLTPAEYLALERRTERRSEYLDGEVFAMGGASRRHNLICLSIGATLWNQLLDRPCEVYTSDMRVRVAATGLCTYPDVVVACGEPSFEDSELDTLLNPTLIVEVLSESTADYDRGAKFEHYRAIPSLREVLFVAQNDPHLLHYRRQADDTWLLSEARDPEAVLSLPSIGADLALADVYAKVRFEA